MIETIPKPKILLVDDEEFIHTIVRFAAIQQDADLVSAFSGRQARQLFSGNTFSLAILDLVLPDETGLDILSDWRKNGSEIPVLIISGHLTGERLERAKSLNVSRILVKPFELNVICAEVEKAVSAYRQKTKVPEKSLFDVMLEPTSEIPLIASKSVLKAKQHEIDSEKGPSVSNKISVIEEKLENLLETIKHDESAGEDDVIEISENEADALLSEFFTSPDTICLNDDISGAEAEATYEKMRNGSFAITLNHDETMACLEVRPPAGGGRQVVGSEIFARLDAMNINFGILSGEIANAVSGDFSEPFENPLVIARGLPPKHGKDGRIVFHFEGKVKPLLDPDSSEKADYHETSKLINVSAGDLLAEILPPEPGEYGKSVKGTAIPFKKGIPAVLVCGENCRSEEENTKFYACADGHAVITGSILSVLKLLHIKGDVDFSTGNVHFKGDVIVDGSVLDDFLVEATGTVKIGNNIYAAVVKAGKDLIVGKGILTRKKGKAVAGGKVYAKFCENALIEGVEGIVISDSSLHSTLYANGLIEIQKGRLMGGIAMSRDGIHAPEIGTTSGGKVDVWVGRCFLKHLETQDCEKRYGTLEKLQCRIRNTIVTLRKQMPPLNEMTPSETAILARILKGFKKISAEMLIISERIAFLKPSYPDGFDNPLAVIQVTKKICAGNSLKFGNHDFSLPVDLLGKRKLQWDENTCTIGL